MNVDRTNNNRAGDSTKSAKPGWWLVASRELADLWIGTRALGLLILFSILLGIMSFLLASNNELSLIPPNEMVFLTLQITIAIGLFVGLSIGADTISGERDRATLEGLLLTPTSRRHIVLGKFIAAISLWPAALLIASAYLAILAPSGNLLGQTLLWGALLGSVLVAGFTGFGMLVSFYASSNKTSLSFSLVVYILFLLPTQFPGTAQTGAVGRFVKRINPMESTNQFLEKVLVNNRTPEEMASWLMAPIIFAALVFVVLFWFASPNLRLEGGRAPRVKSQARVPVSLLVIAILVHSVFTPVRTVFAADSVGPKLDNHDAALQISIDMDYEIVKTGEEIEFTTLVTYNGDTPSPPMVVAMNIVNLGDGDPVDPEDWSPERTQSLESLTTGQSADQNWTVRAILEGDYLVYMVVLPEPEDPRSTSQPIASSGIHLTVEQFTRLNPGGVLPLALGMPIGLGLLLAFILWRRRAGVNHA